MGYPASSSEWQLRITVADGVPLCVGAGAARASSGSMQKYEAMAHAIDVSVFHSQEATGRASLSVAVRTNLAVQADVYAGLGLWRRVDRPIPGTQAATSPRGHNRPSSAERRAAVHTRRSPRESGR
jgi:hypothetical protein